MLKKMRGLWQLYYMGKGGQVKYAAELEPNDTKLK